MTNFTGFTETEVDLRPGESPINVAKAWSDKIDQEMLKALAAMPRGHQMYLVAAPPAYEALKMHVEPLDYPDTPYRFRMPFDYMPVYRMPGITAWGAAWDGPPEPKVELVVWREEPVIEAVPVWQYWVAAAVFAMILCLAGGVV